MGLGTRELVRLPYDPPRWAIPEVWVPGPEQRQLRVLLQYRTRLVPQVYASGKRRYTGHISRPGGSTLRWILIQAAHQAVRVPGPLRAFFGRLRARKGYKVAIVAAARKLLTLIWTLLTQGEPYRVADPLRTQVKERRMERRAVPYPVAQACDLARGVRRLVVEELPLPTAAEERACAFS